MIPLDHPHPRTRRRRIAGGVTGLALLAGALWAAPAQAVPSQTIDPLHPNFGPNVQIFSPATPLAEIQSTMDALADQQRDAEMSSARKAVYFLPGDYGTAEAPATGTGVRVVKRNHARASPLRMCAASAAENPAVATDRSGLSTVTRSGSPLKSSHERNIESSSATGSAGCSVLEVRRIMPPA